MSRLECLGTSSKVSQKQVTLDVTSTLTETHKPEEVVEAKAFSDKPQRSLPVRALSHSVKGPGSAQGKVLLAGEHAIEPPPEESITITLGAEECYGLAVVPIQDLKMKDPKRPQLSDSAVAAGKAHAPPPTEALPSPEPHVEEDQTEEEDDENEGRRAPLELMAEFLKAVMGKDFQLASKLCEMILIYEPENPEARQFLPLIQEKLLEEQEEEHSNDDDEDDDGDDDDDDSYSSDEGDSDDSGSDEEASQSSGSSSSSSSEDDEDEDMQGNRHKLCPPSHLPP